MLRFCILLAVVFSFCAASAIKSSQNNEEIDAMEPFILEDEIREVLKNLSIQLRPKDPYVMREVDYELESEYLRLKVEAKDVLFRGFSKFEATDIKNTIAIFPPGIKTTFNVNFEELHVIVPYYFVDGMAVFVPMYGSGAVNLVARNINGGAFAQIATGISGKMTIKKLEIRLNITETNLFVTGVIHNEPFSQIVSTSTTECFSEFVNLYNNRLGKLLGNALIDPLNNILNPPATEDEWDSESNDDLKQKKEQISRETDKNEIKKVSIGPYDFEYKVKIN